jgi:hypothetical protein
MKPPWNNASLRPCRNPRIRHVPDHMNRDAILGILDPSDSDSTTPCASRDRQAELLQHNLVRPSAPRTSGTVNHRDILGGDDGFHIDVAKFRHLLLMSVSSGRYGTAGCRAGSRSGKSRTLCCVGLVQLAGGADERHKRPRWIYRVFRGRRPAELPDRFEEGGLSMSPTVPLSRRARCRHPGHGADVS